MARGRPIKSLVRENIIEILYFLKKAYGYEIYKHYIEIFPKTTMRNIYYHLRKGLAIKEFEIERIEREKGNYSWGPEAEKTYYKLGPNANPKIDSKVKKYFEKKK
jgi:DNA-binding transcriptional ArsR family regulator